MSSFVCDVVVVVAIDDDEEDEHDVVAVAVVVLVVTAAADLDNDFVVAVADGVLLVSKAWILSII